MVATTLKIMLFSNAAALSFQMIWSLFLSQKCLLVFHIYKKKYIYTENNTWSNVSFGAAINFGRGARIKELPVLTKNYDIIFFLFFFYSFNFFRWPINVNNQFTWFLQILQWIYYCYFGFVEVLYPSVNLLICFI